MVTDLNKILTSLKTKNINTQTGNKTKEFHDFFTPAKQAKHLFNESKKYLKSKPYINKILEPAVGSGNLIWPFLESEFNIEITAMDIQLSYLEFLLEESKKRGYNIKIVHQTLKISNF